MDKKEQSFVFSDTTKQPTTAEKQKTITAIPLSAKIIDSTSDNDNVVKAVKAVPRNSDSHRPVTAINVARAIPLTPADTKPEDVVKATKVVPLTPADTKTEDVMKVARAVSLKKTDETQTASSSAIKDAKITPDIAEETLTEPSDIADRKKSTGPTRKLPIPLNSEEGIQLTDENIAHRMQNAENKPLPDTGPTQKIAIPASENVRINLDDKPDKPAPVSKTNTKKTDAAKTNRTTQATNHLNVKFGPFLKKARMAKNLSLADVEDKTRIRKCYIEALEEENFNNLPPIVYVCAYVKTLCVSYEIDNDMQELTLSELKKLLPTHLSNETIQNLDIDCEIDEAEEHKLKLIVTSSVAVIALLCIIGAVSLWLMNSEKQPIQQPLKLGLTTKFDRSELLQLSPPQSIKMTVLIPDFKTTN
jgi:transcriptional regulator with XRE-family HTH domain